MRILRVIASMDPATGGPCQGIRNSIAAMAQLDVTNEVVSLDLPSAAFLGIDDFKIIPLGIRQNPWAYSSKLMPWLVENIKNYDAVILHGLWLYHGRSVQKAMSKIKPEHRPLWYVMPHGMLDPYFQKAADRKLKAIRNLFYWKLIERKVIESADGILFTCREEEILAKNTFEPYRPKHTINVGYGIQPPPMLNIEMKAAFYKTVSLNPEEPYFLFLSRIHQKKGVDLLIEAYAKYLTQIEDSASVPKLVIAGPGIDSDFGKKMANRVAGDILLKERVIFPGMLSGDAKWGAFYHTAAFILPSHQENFGIAVAEALACAAPVLISDKVNIWREIKKGKAGIVRPDTDEGTYSLIRNWMELSEEKKLQIRNHAFNTYVENFKINTVIQNLINVLSNNFAQPQSGSL